MEAYDWLWLFVKCSLSIVKITRLIFIRETSLCHTTPTFLARYNLEKRKKKKKKKKKLFDLVFFLHCIRNLFLIIDRIFPKRVVRWIFLL